MRAAIILVAAVWAVSVPPAAGADEARLSCAELAERRAAQQFLEEDAARQDRQTGQVGSGDLQRELLRLDAESYRTRVYTNCLRLRTAPAPEEQTAPAHD